MKTLLAAAVLFFGWIAGAHATCPNYNTSQPNTTATSLSVMTADRVNITGGCINNVDVTLMGAAGGAGNPVVGTTPITSGATTRVLYDNAGVLGEYSISGTGSVAMTNSPVLVTPNLGTPSAVTLTSATGLPITGGTTGTLGVTRGGTGLTTVAADQVYVGTAADTFTAKSIGDCDDTAGNHLNYDTTTHAFSCGNSASGGGGATGFGVDGGGSAQAVTGTATISNGTRLVKVASGWATGTLTLPAISAVSSDTCIRVEDGGNFVDASHTLTLKGGVSDGLNGGAANGTVGAFTTAGTFLIACVSATNNWNVGPGSIATSSAPSNQFANGVTINGLSYAQPAVTNISGFGTNVATALAANLSANGGLTKTIFSGAKALATSAISSAACTSAQTDTATGTLTTDVVLASFNGDPTAVTGYVPLTAGMLTIMAYPTADTVNFKVCNNTSGSITPGAITLNWRVVR